MTKRRKRDISGVLTVDDYPLRWTLKSEQIWSPTGDHMGLRISVERSDEAHRELILEYPFCEMPGGKTARPDVKVDALEGDIRRAIDAGWKPKSRGRPFVFPV
ncbi:MAG TPA: hypothetical protein VGI89_00725 [Rhizomicrobium sp.]